MVSVVYSREALWFDSVHIFLCLERTHGLAGGGRAERTQIGGLDAAEVNSECMAELGEGQDLFHSYWDEDKWLSSGSSYGEGGGAHGKQFVLDFAFEKKSGVDKKREFCCSVAMVCNVGPVPPHNASPCLRAAWRTDRMCWQCSRGEVQEVSRDYFSTREKRHSGRCSDSS